MSATSFDRFARLKSLHPARTPAPAETRGYRGDVPHGAARLAEILGAATHQNRYGDYVALRRWFSECIGPEPPHEQVNLQALRLLCGEAAENVSDPRRWLFLDTETTGLAGGTGTYPFMVGIAWWEAGGLEVEQFFLREPSEEHSMLLALAERLAERPVLVTFNGKSFDWPLLDTRYRMTRKIRVPEPAAHLDFLHPARHLWRLRLGSVRLAELERHVLGWDRGPDMPSEYIPSLYFDFLRGGPVEPLVPIFHHNQMDLRGLAGITARVLAVLADPESCGADGLEMFGVSRICERRGDAARARKFYASSIAAELPRDTHRAAQKAMAALAKRAGDHDAAIALWEEMIDNSRTGFEAYEQLAIHYERRTREPQRAIAMLRKALRELRAASRLGTIAPAVHRKHKAQFERRLARLERKMRASAPLLPETQSS